MAAVTRIDVQPAEGRLLSDPFTMTVGFALPELLEQASWQVSITPALHNAESHRSGAVARGMSYLLGNDQSVLASLWTACCRWAFWLTWPI